MSSLLNLLLGAMTSSSSVNTLSHQSGGSDAQIKKLLILAVPILLKAMTKNASSEAGALSLLGALGQHKQTTTLAEQINEADRDDGEKILKHILGKKNDSVVNSLADESGLNSDQVGMILKAIAPALLSGLAAATLTTAKKKKKKNQIDLSDGLDFSDIMAMFGSASQAEVPALMAAETTAKKEQIDGTQLLGVLASLMK